MSFKAILQQPSQITALADFINDLVSCEELPKEIVLGRLFCLNKNCNEPGNEKSIRPLVIMSMIVRIIEYPLNKILKTTCLNPAQLGFREKLSTELNILRIRSRLNSLQYENYDRKNKLPKRYILLVDFSEAFDRVNHKILVEKMIRKNVPEPVINVLIKLLNSGCLSLDLERNIAVGSGVGQGKICSPLEFDIYIDDLLDTLALICHTCLGFADDTGYVCRDLKELEKVIDALEEWSRVNGISINRKKSGILIINDDAIDCNNIRGFPVVTEYNYLGVCIDSKLRPGRHISKIRSKLKVYLNKNRMLQQKYFTPFSLLRIFEYFVKSRVSYGISCFMDDSTQINRLSTVLFEHLKSLYGLPVNISHKRLQLVLGEPDIQVRLAIRLLKNWHKYVDHFKEAPEKLRPVIEKYFEANVITSPVCDYNALKSEMIHRNLVKISKDYPEHRIRVDHREFLKKYVFTHPDKRDFFLIRFFTNSTKGTCNRLFPKCICGDDNDARHGLDKCAELLSDADRKEYSLKMSKLIARSETQLSKQETLYDLCSIAFFTVTATETSKKTIREMVTLLKEIIFKVVINHKERDQAADD